MSTKVRPGDLVRIRGRLARADIDLPVTRSWWIEYLDDGETDLIHEEELESPHAP